MRTTWKETRNAVKIKDTNTREAVSHLGDRMHLYTWSPRGVSIYHPTVVLQDQEVTYGEVTYIILVVFAYCIGVF